MASLTCAHPGCTCDNYREELVKAPHLVRDGNCINCDHAVNQHPRCPAGGTTTGATTDSVILATLQDQTRVIHSLFRVLVGVNSPVPESTASQRATNQSCFRETLKLRYPHCTNPENPQVLRCMVLKHFFSAKLVVAGHIIGLTNRQSYALVGMSYSADRYNERNGLLLYRNIDNMYGNQLITFIYSETDHKIRLQVLYDDVLNMQVGDLTRRVIGVKAKKSSPLLYRHINGWELDLPNFTIQPYRRAIVFVSQTACNNALGSTRPHNCLLALGLTNERWAAMLDCVRGESLGFGESPFGKKYPLSLGDGDSDIA